MDKKELWERYKKYLYHNEEIGLTLDISRIHFNDEFLARMEALMQKAYKNMEDLEGGAIANPDEKRMVGHYWLRNSMICKDENIRKDIEPTISSIKAFSSKVHSGEVLSQGGKPFKNILVIGIGGSALGPQLAASALTSVNDKMTPFFFDNTDPDGIDIVLHQIGEGLSETLCLVISKSGGTAETRNGMLEAKRAYEQKGLNFAKHSVAVTGQGSKLYNTAKEEGWIEIFPMWDWVGGRTSETSAVGLLPACLQGIDIDSLLRGARLCDIVTRSAVTLSNPSALLALMWHHATNGKGDRYMVILPYKDRLSLLAKYLQQLIMESLGKEEDLEKRVVNQGITVYGNKGSTDQHAYVQQLREGVNNFFVTFIEVLKDRQGGSLHVEKDVTCGDYLSSFFLGTRTALYDNDRESITITIEQIDAFHFGVLIALYERAVGFYASLVDINAYHQPGVEAGKKACNFYIELQVSAFEFLRQNSASSFNAEQIAAKIDASDEIEAVFKILMHAGKNPDHKIKLIAPDQNACEPTSICNSKFQYIA
ncbi:glucose-6-phosphate isomerase [Candidatus Magnetoovum chiemensis]|nr:glucose-6-phosphate isomerase [Candidatus Magnetoovum chiemensis]